MSLMHSEDNVASPPAAASTSFNVRSEMGIIVRVSLSPMTAIEFGGLGPDPTALGHHLYLSGSATASGHPSFDLGRKHLCAITRAMIEEINALRDSWLDVADIRENPESLSAGYPPALVLTLVPSSTPEQACGCEWTRVRLDWYDSRSAPAWPLSLLLEQIPLSTHLRDVVQRATSRIIVKALLGSPASAPLFHGLWRQRRVQVDPLIGSLADSLSALASNIKDKSLLSPVLGPPGWTSSSPCSVSLRTLLMRLDHSTFPAQDPPPAWKRTRLRPATLPHELDIAELPETDDDQLWLPVETFKPISSVCQAADEDSCSDSGLSIFHPPSDTDILEF